MMLLGSVIAVYSGVISLYASFYANLPSGAAIVLTSTALFGVAWLVRKCREWKLGRAAMLKSYEEHVNTERAPYPEE